MAASTAYDAYSPANVAALNAIMSAWVDTGVSFAYRVAAIKSGVGAGSYKLDSTTVIDDNVQDVLAGDVSGGAQSSDWFIWNSIGGTVDKITDFASLTQAEKDAFLEL